MHRRTSQVRRTSAALACIALGGAALAACSSSPGTSTSAGGSSSSPAAGSAADSGAAASGGVAKAKNFVAAHTSPPSAITVTQPLAVKPPTGKNIVYVSVQTTAGNNYAIAIKQAAKALGWNVKVISGPGTPQTAAANMALAVQEKPDAVLQAGFPVATFPTQVAQLAASKTPYISTGTTDAVGNGVTANVGNTADYVRRGLWLANWVVADSNGTANTVVFNLSTYPVLDNLTTSFQQTVSSLCSRCKVDVQDVQTASVGTTLPAQMVSYLQSHPSVNYVMMTYGDMSIGVPSALAAAGLSSKVKIVTQSGSLQQVADGQQAINTPEPDQMIGWMMMDAAVRALSGQPVSESQYAVLPGNYVTKANVGNPSVPYAAVPNFAAQFLKLWHVG